MADKPKSIITKWTEYCMVCGKPREHIHHGLYNTGKRKLADQDKLLIPLCMFHHEDSKYGVHNNAGMKVFSQALSEACWERQFLAEKLEELSDTSADEWIEKARQDFFHRYGEFFM